MTAIALQPAQKLAYSGPARVRLTRHAHASPPCVAQIALLILVLTAGIAMGAWYLSGGRLLIMQTASMCPRVCVGSLVADRPLVGQVHLGQIISFHPPDDSLVTYTHQVSKVFANGTIQTKGIANPRHDPWLITRSDIVAKVSFSVWGLGWFLKALPILTSGAILWTIARPTFRTRGRRNWDTIWLTLVVVLPVLILKPFIRGVITQTAPDAAHRDWLSATVINTGMLTARFRARHAKGSVVSARHIGIVNGPMEKGGTILYQTASLHWWGWVIVASIVLSPIVSYLWRTMHREVS